MEELKYITKLSNTGKITIPFGMSYFGKQVEIIVKPIPEETKKYSIDDFLQECTGILNGISPEKIDDIKYLSIMEKHCK